MGAFEQAYPHVARWVKDYGWIEIGHDGLSPSFVRALDEGGLIWEGDDATEGVDGVLRTLDSVLAEWIREQIGG